MTAFGTTRNGQTVEAITIAKNDLTATILTFGATLHSLHLQGVPHSLTLGSDSLQAYEADLLYFGALVGPLANRISNASAPLNGQMLQLVANEGTTSLHGGPRGIHQEVWTVLAQSTDSVTLELVLTDGKDGYPGHRVITARFTISEAAQLTLEISATTDADTLINIANHSYWNLDGSTTIDGHILTVPADSYVPIDAACIPTGIATVDGTGFDLREATVMDPKHRQRLDHNFCLKGDEGVLKPACTLTGQNGVTMVMQTTEVGLQVFDAWPISSGEFKGHNGAPYAPHSGIALEAQRWPDAPNQTGFPSCMLRAGETYQQVTNWTFTRLNLCQP
ncbi:aldose epimerase family protein [Pacificibacter marinus]|uniref:aldose epimerase family protein n=1 Tax=Pacificibacter marinus TaxID=658057 RepID=UPI001C07C02A|nr:aldose epimerase family protein [Pacificibacter marinus]MBU2868181.1 galactose mutarotase [Pacificibacter marinus]